MHHSISIILECIKQEVQNSERQQGDVVISILVMDTVLLYKLVTDMGVVVATQGSEDKKAAVSDPSYDRDDVTTHHVVQLSKLPDAHEPCVDEIPAIERADWPAPPYPAAAYPELRMYTVV